MSDHAVPSTALTSPAGPALGAGPPALAPDEFRRLGHRAVDMLADWLAGVDARPVFTPMTPAARADLLEESLPDAGAAPAAIFERFASAVLPHPMGNGHPRFFGWVNSPPAPMGVLGDLLAAGMNPSCAGGDHAAIYVERCATRWLMELLGFPLEGSMGVLVSGGSTASLTCLAAARHRAAAAAGWNVRAEGLQGGRPRLVLYMSEEGHSCVRKAAELLGLGSDAVRILPSDDGFHLDPAAVAAAMTRDRTAGLVPFCVVASAGTVSTGAVDPLAALADLCQRERCWLHVDGAYGAVAAVVPALADRFHGLARVDSIALDPHKWLSVPVECGAALVRDGAALRDAFSLVPAYLRTEEGQGFGGLPWFAEYGFQQTRGFRALKLWMTLQHLGRGGVRALISRHLALAARLARLIDAAPDLERLAPVELSIVCFRYVPPGASLDGAALDLLNKRIMETIQCEGRAFVSNAVLRGRFALRACVLHYATTDADLTALVDAVRDAGARCARALVAGGGR
jgi:glutamate/tyrosine decarboxylase-like PLP-dependent enzyme